MASQLLEGIQTAQLGEQKEAQAQSQLTTQVNNSISGVLKIAGEMAKAVQTGETRLTPEQFAENLDPVINSALRTSQIAQQRGLQTITPEAIQSLRQQLLSTATSQQLAATKGEAEGTKRVAQAGAVVEQLGAEPREAQLAAGAIKETRPDLEGQSRSAKATVLRKEFNSLTKDFRKVNDSWGRIQAASEDPSAAGDLALIFNFMKMLDPGSTVRESEFATAANSAGIPDRIRAIWNKARKGERLVQDTRADFLNQAEQLFGSQERNFEQLRTQYRQFAINEGVSPSNVLTEFRAPEKEKKKEDDLTSEEQAELETLRRARGR